MYKLVNILKEQITLTVHLVLKKTDCKQL